MKKLIFLLIPIFVFGQQKTQVSILAPNQAVQLPSAPINLTTCITLCNATPVNYQWKLISGPALTFSSTSGIATTISGFSSGVNVIYFGVLDNTGKTTSDTLTINFLAVANIPPIANAGKDTTYVLPQNALIIDGSASTDPDGSIQAYTLSGPNIIYSTGPKFFIYNLGIGTYTYTLTVTDNNGATGSASIKVTVNPPIICPVCPICPAPRSAKQIIYSDNSVQNIP